MAEDAEPSASADKPPVSAVRRGLDVPRDRVHGPEGARAELGASSAADPSRGLAAAPVRTEDPRQDEALMIAFREGETAAFGVLVARHQRGLFNFLLRSVADRGRAEELLQDVFVRVIRSKHRYRQTAKFTTWVYKIARNITIDESRRAKFRRHASLDAKRGGSGGEEGRAMIDRLAADDVGTDAAAAAPAIRHRIADAVAELPEEQRAVFLMRQLQGMSFKEIGEVVDAPENTVKSRMRYALEKLRSELADMDPRTDPGPSPRKQGA